MLLAALWQNPVVSLDANDDGAISPLDALLPINYLIDKGAGPVTRPLQAGEPYRDVSGDNYISPVDALQVINAIIDGFRLPITLREPAGIANQASITIGLGQDVGSRTYRFALDANFDDSDTSAALEDMFVVYLVDKDDPTRTLLDRGVNGTSIFALSGTQADFVPGIVRFDGQVVEIDLTPLSAPESARLVFQTLNSDHDNGTHFVVRPVSNEVDPEALVNPLPRTSQVYAESGVSLEFAGLMSANQLTPVVSNVRYNETTGEYRADVQLRNDGLPAGRDIALELTGLSDGVTLRDPSGLSPNGAPYLSFRDAIPPGGLDRGAVTSLIEVTFDVIDGAPLRWTTSSWAGPTNQAPSMAPVDPIVVVPGSPAELVLSASDPDGDPVSFTLVPSDAMPTMTFDGNGRLYIRPSPDEVGTYTFTVLASDGLLRSSQPVQITVTSGADGPTRISGAIQNIDDSPLANVPIQLGGIETKTDDEGRFSLHLPPGHFPTELFAIDVPAGDSFFDPNSGGDASIPFRRAVYEPASGDSVENARRHPNLITSFVDASMVYGADAERAAALRTNDGTGRLKVTTSPHGDLLPQNNTTHFPQGPLHVDNSGPFDSSTLFAAGDIRASENPGLISLHTLFVREHNRKADELATDSSLSGEEIYQRAKQWVNALIQQFTYNEFLPLLLGQDALPAYSGYDSTVNPAVSGLFSGAAFRLGHSLATSHVMRLDASGVDLPGGPLPLRHAFFSTAPILNDGIEPYLRGLAAQQAEELDLQIIPDLQNFLFGPPGAGGLDLAAMNIQRGRDLGLPSYNQARIDFGLTAVSSFDDISSSGEVQATLATAYRSVDEIDVWVGGLAEDHVAGAMVGPLFHAIIRDQFIRLRDGDRFWFENEQLLPTELAAVRSDSLAALIERNSNITGLPNAVLTSALQPAGFGAGGTPANLVAESHREIDGSQNNLTDPRLGATGSQLLQNYTLDYGDDISTPSGADRPNARVISVTANTQVDSPPNSAQATSLFTIWGQFLDHDISLTPGGLPDALVIDAAALSSAEQYPRIAENLEILLGHELYLDTNNVVTRPIYLPAIDMSNAVTIDPLVDTEVTTAKIPGAMLFVAAGTVEDAVGNPFTGQISLTEVPVERTPIELPPHLRPDSVITVQPGGLKFTTPAPLTMPNPAGYAPGLEMELWSVDPISGDFAVVGTGRVSDDGSLIEPIAGGFTTSIGGIRNSSWHVWAPSGIDGDVEPLSCPVCSRLTVEAGSAVELQSGAYLETHTLPGFRSLGVNRALTLTYNSQRANPEPIVQFNMTVGQQLVHVSELPNYQADYRLGASLSIDLGNVQYTVPNGQLTPGFGNNEFVWELGRLTAGQELGGAIKTSLGSVPTGVYEVTLRAGAYRLGAGSSFGANQAFHGQVQVINASDHGLGRGWEIAGVESIVTNPNGSLLVYGGGSEMIYRTDPDNPGVFMPPPGHFSTIEQLPNGGFMRTMTDRTISTFHANGRLLSTTDRNGNMWQYQYDGGGLLTKIIEPTLQETVFNYSGGMLTSILEPGGSETTFEYDTSGNLTKITNPDQSERRFSYDSNHRMISELPPRGFVEQTTYNPFGQVKSTRLADGSTISISAVRSRGIHPASGTQVPLADMDFRREGMATDPSGNPMQYEVDAAGQLVAMTDRFGQRSRVARGSNGLISAAEDSIGNVDTFEYDASGNLVLINDVAHLGSLDPGEVLPGMSNYFDADAGSGEPEHAIIADMDGDNIPDYVVADNNPLLDGSGDRQIHILYRRDDGSVRERQTIRVDADTRKLAVADMNGDAHADIISVNGPILIHLSDETGGFATPVEIVPAAFIRDLAIADFDDDLTPDVVVATGSNPTNELTIYYGDGTGGVRSPQTFALNDRPTRVQIDDIDGDNDNDVFVQSTSNAMGLTFLRNEGDANFAVSSILTTRFIDDLTIGDFNGDGHLDLGTKIERATVSVRIFAGDGTGSFATPLTVTTNFPSGRLESADLNNDGVDELVAFNNVGDNGGQVIVYSKSADGTFSERSYALGLRQENLFGIVTGFVAIGDVNLDGVMDVLAAAGKQNGNVVTLLGRGDGSLAARQDVDAPAEHIYAIGSGDFNGDGRLDFATANRFDDSVSVFLQQAGGSFAAPFQLATDNQPWDLRVADVTGDQLPDIVVTNGGTNSINVFPGDGAGGFAPRIDMPDGDWTIDLGDVNNDGKNDIISGFAVLLSNGDGQFAEPLPLPFEQYFDLGDINNDGRLDLVSVSSDTLTVRLGNGDGTFAAATDVLISDDTRGQWVQLAHLNDDDFLDVIITDEGVPFGQDEFVTVMLGNGDQTFSGATKFPVGFLLVRTDTGDFNQDGFQDIVVVSAGDDVFSLLLNDRSGGFAMPIQFAVGGELPQSIHVADVDADQRPDVLVGGEFAVSLFRSSDAIAMTEGSLGTARPRRYDYDTNFSQMTSSIDELGRQTTYELDMTTGNTLAVVRPGNVRTEFTYTDYGLLDTETDPLGRITDFDYDAMGRVTAITFAKGTADEAKQRFEYDDRGNQSAFVDENGHRTEYEYDAMNRLIIVRDPELNETRYTYDHAGNLSEVRDARGMTTTNHYDARNRLIKSVDADNQETTFTYDGNGNLLSVTDPLGNTSRTRYDIRDRRVESIDPDGGRTRFRYDTNGNLTSLTDPVGNTTRFLYDSRDRLIREIDPLNATINYVYDGADNVVRKTDRNGRVTEYRYDHLNRLVEEQWVGGGNTITYSYDAVGNLLTANDVFSSLEFAYDKRDRVVTADNAGTPEVPNVVLAYAYDGVGNVLSVTDTIEGTRNAVTGYQYDTLNRLVTLSQTAVAGALATDIAFLPSDKRVDFTYNPLGQYDHIRRYNDLAGEELVIDTEYAYDSLSRVQSITHVRDSGSPESFFNYEYDSASRITQITDIVGTIGYSYDSRDQLIGADYTDTTRPDEYYIYDANGNRIASHLHGAGYVTGPANRLLSDGAYTYEYDAEGNIIRRTEIATGTTRAFEWDHRNRLQGAIDRTNSNELQQSVTYRYDSLDRRIGQESANARSGHVVSTRNVFDREDIVFVSIVEEDNGLKSTSQQRILHGELIDQALAIEDSAGTHSWLIDDHQGSIVGVVEDNGTSYLVETDSFGNYIGDISRDLPAIGFTGRELSSEIDSIFFRSRLYDATNGRFLSEDSRGVIATATNVFAFANNSPTGQLDPFGRSPLWEMFEQSWRIGPYDAWKYGFIGVTADGIANDYHDRGLLPGRGQVNAFRHCIFACALVKVLPMYDAIDALITHEVLHPNSYNDNLADRHNNKEGIKCGRSPDSGGCEPACYLKLKQGLLDERGN